MIREAISVLEWHDSERAAIQSGLDAMHQGRIRSFEEFDHDFRSKNGIIADG